ncbi:hypothetical protein FH972_021212 [Carpinus fangiana]|uniref:Uncharacterized protein n=1 Tax=Carpinus fangiana TaxID=176857 RepID=A0A5N6KP92_9ROSI|nr:hypothetical protein FH972_021212 [Carpinus fangiana]
MGQPRSEEEKVRTEIQRLGTMSGWLFIYAPCNFYYHALPQATEIGLSRASMQDPV